MTHEEVVAHFVRERPEWRRDGLRQALLRSIDPAEPIGHLAYVPDAYYVAPAARFGTVQLLEVDGHSYTDKRKLRKMLRLWAWLDAHSWAMALTTINLFTGAISTTTDDDFARLWWGPA